MLVLDINLCKNRTLLDSNYTVQGGPKSKPLPNYQNIVLKPASEKIFIRQIKV